MRNFTLSVCLLTLTVGSAGLAAQTPESSGATTTTTTSQAVSAPQRTVAEVQTLAPDALVMSSGSIVVVRGTQKSRLETEVRLTNGSILTPGGTIRHTDGSTATLSDGQAVSTAGKIGPVPATIVTESTGTAVRVVPATR